MPLFCTNCGTQLPEGAAFCTECGTKVSGSVPENLPAPEPVWQPPQPEAVPPPVNPFAPSADIPPAPDAFTATVTEVPPAPDAPPAPVAETPPEAPQPKKEKKQKKPKKEKKPKTPPAPAPAAGSGNGGSEIPVGAVLLGACMAMECLPYLMKSLLFVAVKGTFGNFVSILFDVLGFAAAGAVLYLGTKRTGKASRFSSALLFTALWGGVRAADQLLLRNVSIWEGKRSLVLIAADILIFLLFTAFAVRPCCDVFTARGKCRRRGVIPAYLLLLLAGLLVYCMPMLRELLPVNGYPSFFSAFSFRLFTAFLEAALLTGAVKLQLKRLGEEKRPPSGSPLTAAGLTGGVLALLGAVACFVGNARDSLSDTILNDVTVQMLQGEFAASSGDVGQVLRSYKAAAAHCEAWRAVAAGSGYALPKELSEDRLLVYLSHSNDSADGLRKYLAVSLDDRETDLWGPLMLMRYRQMAKAGTLSDEAKAHRAEIMEFCLANSCFTADYPLPDELQEHQTEIAQLLNADTAIQEKIEIASVTAAALRGDISGTDAAGDLLSLAEQYPQNMELQLVSGYITSQNTRDGAERLYERAVKTLNHYLELWEAEYGADAEPGQRAETERSLGEMMQDMGHYADAIPVYEKALQNAPEDTDLMQSLAYCYNHSGESDKGYALCEKLYAQKPDDAAVLWSYGVGALKHGEAVKAVEAAGKLADLIRAENYENSDNRDELLYNLVLYLSLNDSASWTDYQYRVYDGDENTDPAVLAELKKNDFLYDYVRAVYYEKQKNDQETALPFAKKALAAQEQSGRLWFLNGIIYFDAKQYTEALQAYETADRLENDDPTIQFALANAYDATEQYELALEYCDKALAHYKNGVDHTNDYYGVSGHAGGLRASILKHLEG